MPDVYRQTNWTEEKLQQAGFEHYERRKQLVMARRLPDAEAPKTIITGDGQKLIATAGYMICYMPGDSVRPSLDDYDHWPVEPTIFAETYAPWDEPNRVPNLVERHMISMGCEPYYKKAGVWAKPLSEDVLVQSLEHEQPVDVPAGRVLAIGARGEPYTMGDETFHERYQTPDEIARKAAPPPPPEPVPASPIRSAVQKLLKFFRR